MERYVWLFPLIFIFHDMEEIIGFGIWLEKNKYILKTKYPKIAKTYQNFSTEGFALAVFEELILCIFFCAIAVITDMNCIWYIWLGSFIACTLHFVIHVGQSIAMKQYIPATITSIICLPFSIWIIYKCSLQIMDNFYIAAIFIIAGIVIVAVNLKLAQKMIGWFTRKMNLHSVL